MGALSHLFERNRAWSLKLRVEDPAFFTRLSRQQHPEYLWIGCSDSRVPATQTVDLAPGEMFVHRNIANLVVHTDLNCLSAMHYAVETLQVKHIIVCGHYGCGGVRAAVEKNTLGLVGNWLRHVQDMHYKHRHRLDVLSDPGRRLDRLCELNVIEQVRNVCRTTIVEEAWLRGQELAVHGWIYALDDGLLHDLGVSISGSEALEPVYRSALVRLE